MAAKRKTAPRAKSKRSAADAVRHIPVRLGRIYCSPACGFGCTWAAHQEAHKNGAAMQKALGEGWEISVWENGGWHASIKREHIQIMDHGTRGKRTGRFSADINLPGIRQVWVYAATPLSAYRRALRSVQKTVREAAVILEQLGAPI